MCKDEKTPLPRPEDSDVEDQDVTTVVELNGPYIEHELLEKGILEYLDACDLLNLGCVNYGLYVLCNEEPLWMTLCIRKFGTAVPCPTWKRACLVKAGYHHLPPRYHQPAVEREFQSVFLSNRWYRCNAILERFEPTEVLIEKRAITEVFNQFKFAYDFPRKPVALLNSISHWKCAVDSSLWSLESLASRFPDVKWDISHTVEDVEKITMTMPEYLNYLKYQSDESPFYIFDGRFGEKAQALLDEYDKASFSPLFNEDFLSVLGEKQRPAHRWFVAGPARTGAPWHRDPTGTSAWNALIKGRKRWALYPSNHPPPGVEVLVDGSDVVHVESHTSLRWYLDIYPTLTEEERPLEVVQEPNDVLFIPSGWWHMVLNLEDTVSVTENYIGLANLRAGVQELYNEKGPGCALHFVAKLAREIPTLRPQLGILESIYSKGFSSELEYKKSFQDGKLWRGKLRRILVHHRMIGSDDEVVTFESLTKRLNPVFLHRESQAVIKLFSHYPTTDADVFGDMVESPISCNTGLEGKACEVLMLQYFGEVLSEVPRLLHHGKFYGTGYGAAYDWPYIVVSKTPGIPLTRFREKKQWATVTGKLKLQKCMCQVACWLGHLVAKIHGDIDSTFRNQLRNARPNFSQRDLWLTQRYFALSSLWREGIVSKILLSKVEDFVSRYLPWMLTVKNDDDYVALHGDLQGENIFVCDLRDDEMEATGNFIRETLGVGESVEDSVGYMVNTLQLRLRSLALMSDLDWREVNIPLGHRLLLQNAAAKLDLKGLKALKRDTIVKCTGVIDFADAFLGDSLYEIVAIHIGTFYCDLRKLRLFVKAYNEQLGIGFDDGKLFGYPRELFPYLAMTATLLHPCNPIRSVLAHKAECLEKSTSWEQVADSLFGLVLE